MSSGPFGNVNGFDVYLAKDAKDAPAGSIAGMAFTGQADGAIPNGHRVRKANSEPGDSFPDGTGGTVLASVELPRPALVADQVTPAVTITVGQPRFGYYVAFDPNPVPCFIAGNRLEEAE